MIDNVENVSRLSTKANDDLILMVAPNRNNYSRPKIAGYTDDRKEIALKRGMRGLLTVSFGTKALVIPRCWLVELRDFLFDPADNVGGNVFDYDLPS